MIKIKQVASMFNLQEFLKKHEGQFSFEEHGSYKTEMNIDITSGLVSVNCSDSFYNEEVNKRAEILLEMYMRGLIVLEVDEYDCDK